MTFKKLCEIINEIAAELKDNAECEGAWNDGGCSALLSKLKAYKEKLVVQYDLKPSEFHQLDDIEVGEPEEFAFQIERYKIKLARKINL